jgi:ATP-binding cassette subfamily B protein
MKFNTNRTLGHFWKEMSRYKLFGLGLVLSIVLGTILDSIIPIYSKNFFNELTSGKPKDIIVAGLMSILLMIAVFKVVRWVLWRIAFLILNFYESRIIADLSIRCFQYLQDHSFAFFSNNFTGSIVKKCKGFVRAFEVLADQLFYELLPTFVTMTVITIVLSKVNIFIGLGMLAWITIFMLINWMFTMYKLKYDVQRTEAETATNSYLADTVTNNINIKLFNGADFENKGYSILAEKLHKLRWFSWNLSFIFYGLQSFLLIILEVGIMYFAVSLWNKNVLTIGDFVLIQSYIITVIMMVWDFGRIITKIYENLADAEEMTVLLDLPHEIVDEPNALDLDVKSGSIKFNKISFTYEKGKKVFDGFSLEVRPRETIALVGTSGAGKTTLVKLLLRLYELNKGKIFIDGQDISKVTQKSLRENISMVPQDPILFHRSLMENIRYGKPEATDEEVINASKLAHCHEFVEKLKDGYQTFVGERGIKLSGGERQRVAIARAILRNAPILIMDEATSSLDSESEKYIQESLDELMKDKTVIVVAHRLSTIKKVDRIVVIDKKKVVEDGNHESLTKLTNGIYKKFWEIQVGGFIQ